MEVHRQLGPGLLESIYESALVAEFELQSIPCKRQVPLPVCYKGKMIGEYKLDLLVEDLVVVEIKSVERHDPIFEAQLLTYLKLTGKKVGLLINFNSKLLKDGIKRFVLFNLIFSHSPSLILSLCTLWQIRIYHECTADWFGRAGACHRLENRPVAKTDEAIYCPRESGYGCSG